MQRKLLLMTAVGLSLGLSACGFNQEAGAFLDGGTFGNATMNNHLVQTCQNVSNAKYSSGKCAPRTLDGKYAKQTYDGYISSATERPEVITSFRGTSPGAGNAGGG